MDADRIDELKDRELDVAVAKAKGWEVFRSKDDYFDEGAPHAAEFNTNVGYPAYYDAAFELACVVPNWQENIATAMELWQEMATGVSTWFRFEVALATVIEARIGRESHLGYLLRFLLPEDIARAYLKVRGGAK